MQIDPQGKLSHWTADEEGNPLDKTSANNLLYCTCLLFAPARDYKMPDAASILCRLAFVNTFSAELSPKRSWRGPRSQEVVVGELRLPLHCHHQSDSALKWAVIIVVLMFQ